MSKSGIQAGPVGVSRAVHAGGSSLQIAAGDRRAKRLVVVATALCLGMIWAFVAYWAASSRQETIDATAQVLRRMEHVVEEQTRRQFQLAELAFGVADQWVLDHPGVDLQRDGRFARLLESVRRRSGGALTLYVADSTGESVSVDPLLPVPKTFAAAEFFRAAMIGDANRLQIGAPVAVGSPATWKIPVAQRLTQPAGKAAALVALVDVATLIGLYEEERVRPNGSVALMHRDGTMLARVPHDERVLGQSLVGSQIFREFLPRSDSGFATIDRPVIDGMEKYISYAVMPDFPLLTMVSAASRDVLAGWGRQVMIVFVLAGGISIATLFAARRLMAMLSALSSHAAELEHLATTDVMTGIHNRHSFLQLLYREFARARRYRTPLALLVFDLDFFKQINDGYGHAAGDEALRAFARAAGDSLRGMDVLGRLGGEEFGILLPSTLLDQAEVVAERIRTAVAHIAIETEYGTVRFTTSVGVTQSLDADESIDALLARADAALYAAKAAGRNRVVARAG